MKAWLQTCPSLLFFTGMLLCRPCDVFCLWQHLREGWEMSKG